MERRIFLKSLLALILSIKGFAFNSLISEDYVYPLSKYIVGEKSPKICSLDNKGEVLEDDLGGYVIPPEIAKILLEKVKKEGFIVY